jgi:hypothetical protein
LPSRRACEPLARVAIAVDNAAAPKAKLRREIVEWLGGRTGIAGIHESVEMRSSRLIVVYAGAASPVIPRKWFPQMSLHAIIRSGGDNGGAP